ncbi:MAG: ABC transporter permease [Phycisphaerae bacterium]
MIAPAESGALASTLHRGLQAAAPLLLAASGELLCERAGLLNIGVEGTMLMGALAAVLAGWASGSALVGVVAAAAAGATVGAIYAAWTVSAKRDMIVTGLGINLAALGTSGIVIERVEAACGRIIPPGLPSVAGIDALLPLALAGVIALRLGLWRTRPGLALRAVGENPEAADTAGVRVAVVRWTAALVGSALSGLGGAYLSIVMTRGFQENMTGGRGYLALALVILGRWSPFGVLLAALMFGMLDALQVTLQPSLGSAARLLYPALLALPYVMTLAALSRFTGRARPPAALGQVYDRGR